MRTARLFAAFYGWSVWLLTLVTCAANGRPAMLVSGVLHLAVGLATTVAVITSR